jgi:hypothetical protein
MNVFLWEIIFIKYPSVLNRLFNNNYIKEVFRWFDFLLIIYTYTILKKITQITKYYNLW